MSEGLCPRANLASRYLLDLILPETSVSATASFATTDTSPQPLPPTESLPISGGWGCFGHNMAKSR